MAGRPIYDEKLSERITIPMQKWVREKLEELAAAEGSKLTDFCRQIIMRDMEKRQ